MLRSLNTRARSPSRTIDAPLQLARNLSTRHKARQALATLFLIDAQKESASEKESVEARVLEAALPAAVAAGLSILTRLRKRGRLGIFDVRSGGSGRNARAEYGRRPVASPQAAIARHLAANVGTKIAVIATATARAPTRTKQKKNGRSAAAAAGSDVSAKKAMCRDRPVEKAAENLSAVLAEIAIASARAPIGVAVTILGAREREIPTKLKRKERNVDAAVVNAKPEKRMTFCRLLPEIVVIPVAPAALREIVTAFAPAVAALAHQKTKSVVAEDASVLSAMLVNAKKKNVTAGVAAAASASWRRKWRRVSEAPWLAAMQKPVDAGEKSEKRASASAPPLSGVRAPVAERGLTETDQIGTGTETETETESAVEVAAGTKTQGILDTAPSTLVLEGVDPKILRGERDE